ncbi:uncharacterized protein PV07_10536 [Cladophialophora immunda]|uniref:Uncharacterized protein n=1 Tax=Cladophialophora immunda TaxID=569365 RepID=A0A0D2C0J7_9EURO|nr:uncharacterized protein PV07_10536 [Cladophialophora immunda]KIW24848.1 hypothetical protein PV07_10536 [Cladophialophora immunda]
MAQVLQLVQGMAMSYETKMKDRLKAYENKIEALLEIAKRTWSVERIVALETQNQRMMELIKNIPRPASRPSPPRSSVNPSSSASQPSNLSQSDIIVDLSQTNVQRRAGEVHQVKLSFASEEMAKTARQHVQWLQADRFDQARMLGEQSGQG